MITYKCKECDAEIFIENNEVKRMCKENHDNVGIIADMDKVELHGISAMNDPEDNGST